MAIFTCVMMKKTLFHLFGAVAMAGALVISCVKDVSLEKDILEGSTTAWMTPLPDDTPVTRLSIPGAHDAASASITAWPSYTRTQDLDIAGLWRCGVRAFDLRPAWVDGQMGIYHDKYSAHVTLPQILDALCLALERHPGEGVILLIRHEEEADDNTPQWGPAMGSLLADYRQKLVPWHAGLTLGELRGKMLLLSRNTFPGGPEGAYLRGWTSGGDLSAQKSASLVNAAGETSPFWVQDYYHPDGAEDKWAQVKGMLDAAAAAGEPYPLVVNHASGYVGTLPDYRSNARDINGRTAEYIRTAGKPAGIVMIDFAGTDLSKGKTVAGENLVKALIANNR